MIRAAHPVVVEHRGKNADAHVVVHADAMVDVIVHAMVDVIVHADAMVDVIVHADAMVDVIVPLPGCRVRWAIEEGVGAVDSAWSPSAA